MLYIFLYLCHNSEYLYWERGLCSPELWVPLSCKGVCWAQRLRSHSRSPPPPKVPPVFPVASPPSSTFHITPPVCTEDSSHRHATLWPSFPSPCVMWAPLPSWLIIESTSVKPLLVSLTRCNHTLRILPCRVQVPSRQERVLKAIFQSVQYSKSWSRVETLRHGRRYS